MDLSQFITNNWLTITAVTVVFIAFIITGFWVRGFLSDIFRGWLAVRKWEGSELLLNTLRTYFFQWWTILGALVAVLVSSLSPDIKMLAGKVLASLFVISLFWMIGDLLGKLLRMYFSSLRLPPPPNELIITGSRSILAFLVLLIVLDIFGAPTTPLILLLGVLLIATIAVFRNLFVDFSAGIELSKGEVFNVGDYVKVEGAEEGYITSVSWRTTRMHSLEGTEIVIPNGVLLHSKIVNYGKPLKKARQPFHFFTRLHMRELTGLKARNIDEFLDYLKSVPESVIYYHTHHFLEEHNFLTPEPANDFSLWIATAFGDELLAEKLAAVDIFQYPSLAALRARLITIMEEYLATNPGGTIRGRDASPDEVFHFIKSVSVVAPTEYTCVDLREFVQALRKVTIDSVYFHVFDSKLRLNRGNDFAVWLENSLDEKDLAEDIADLDPYNFSLENLRSHIIRLVERRIK